MHRIWPTQLRTPHIELAIPVSRGIKVLETTGVSVIEECDGGEKCHRVSLQDFEIAIYESDENVASVWYNDPAGRLTAIGRRRKLRLYMRRYTESGTWERQLINAWMEYYFNDTDGVQLVYGVDNDVIRINGHLSQPACAA